MHSSGWAITINLRPGVRCPSVINTRRFTRDIINWFHCNSVQVLILWVGNAEQVFKVTVKTKVKVIAWPSALLRQRRTFQRCGNEARLLFWTSVSQLIPLEMGNVFALYGIPFWQLHCRHDGCLPQHGGSYTVELPRVWSVSRRRFTRCHGLPAVWLQHDGSEISCSSIPEQSSKLLRGGGLRVRWVYCFACETFTTDETNEQNLQKQILADENNAPYTFLKCTAGWSLRW